MIIHFSTLHSPQSTRIFHKFVMGTNEKTGIQAKYVCGGKSDLAFPAGVDQISKDTGGRWYVRLKNLIIGSFKILKVRPDYVQLHDPELLVVTPMFKLFGISVIYDSHENFPAQFTSHNPQYKRMFRLIEVLENFYVNFFVDRVVAATDEILDRFKEVHDNVFLIENGPRSRNRVSITPEKRSHFVYAGLISPNRGILEILLALESEQFKVDVCGPFSSNEYKDKCTNTVFWRNNVQYHGVVTQDDVADLVGGSYFGIVSLENTANYEDSRPTKLYEYVSLGAKVIVSRMPFMEAVVSKHQLGYIFDLDDADSIREAFKCALSDRSALSLENINNFFDNVNYFDDQLLILIEDL